MATPFAATIICCCRASLRLRHIFADDILMHTLSLHAAAIPISFLFLLFAAFHYFFLSRRYATLFSAR